MRKTKFLNIADTDADYTGTSERQYGRNDTIKIDNVRSSTTNEWFKAWSNCPYATFFHSPEWAELWCLYDAEHLSIVSEAIEFSDGVVAVFPLLRKRAYRGLVTTTLSSVSGTYGGWISANKLKPMHLKLLTDHMVSKSALRWRINPFDLGARGFLDVGENNDNAQRISRSVAKISYSIKNDCTHVIDTKKGLDSIMSGWTKNNFRALKRAQRLDVEVRCAVDRSDWQAYFDIYRDALKRWDKRATSHYGWELFKRLAGMGSPFVQLRLAFFNKKPIAGILCLKSMRHVSVWHAVTRTESLRLRPFNCLIYGAIEDAIENKFDWLDLNPSGGHAGVVLSKERLGAVELPCPEILIKSRGTNAIERCPKLLKTVKKKRIGGIFNAAA